MQEYTLEKELNNRIEQHKENVLKMRMQKLYEDLYNTGVVIPIFMSEPPEEMAKREVEQLKRLDRQEFERLYDIAWWEYATQLQ